MSLSILKIRAFLFARNGVQIVQIVEIFAFEIDSLPIGGGGGGESGGGVACLISTSTDGCTLLLLMLDR